MTTPPASEPAPAPAPTEPMPAPAPTPATVASVDLGNAVGADNKVTTASTSFAKNDTIHASVATDGAASKLNAKWTYQDGQTVDSQDKDVAAGPQTTDFSISKPDGWPAGKYKVTFSTGAPKIEPGKTPDMMEMMKRVVAPKFEDPAKTPLEKEVVSGSNDWNDLQVEKPAPGEESMIPSGGPPPGVPSGTPGR